MKKLLTLTLGLVTLTLTGTKVRNQTQTIILNRGYNQGSQPALPTKFPNIPCTPRPSGMVAWWPLDGLTSGEYDDLAGGDNNGTPIGNPSQIPNQYVGNSVQAGTGKYVRVTDAPNLNFGLGSFTIDAWVKYTPGTQTEPIVYKLANSSGSGGGYFLSIVNANSQGTQRKLQLQIATKIYSGPIITATQGTWIFVAATVNKSIPIAGTINLYVGVPSNPLAIANHLAGAFNASSPGTPLLIGRWESNPQANLGIDEVEVFNRALTGQPEIQSIYDARSAGKCKQEDKGMTWVHRTSNAQNGTINVGCSGCDAANGDTVCSQQLPVLCIYKPAPAFQLPVGLNNSDQYNRWSGGVVATTPPVAGSTFSNSVAVNVYCQAQFGPGWRVAEFHDGWGWNFQAYGGTVSAPTVPSTRFWVHINDQPGGNCWMP